MQQLFSCLLHGKFWSGHMYRAKFTSVTRCLVLCDQITSMLELMIVTSLLWLLGQKDFLYQYQATRLRKMVATGTRLRCVTFIFRIISSFINWRWEHTSALVFPSVCTVAVWVISVSYLIALLLSPAKLGPIQGALGWRVLPGCYAHAPLVLTKK
jgi:hypothetical protein